MRWNSAFAYLDEARGRPNLTVLGDTLFYRVEPGVVHTDHGPYDADAIVLAAGAYGSPAILLRSGIGPGLAHDLPVGEGLATTSASESAGSRAIASRPTWTRSRPSTRCSWRR